MILILAVALCGPAAPAWAGCAGAGNGAVVCGEGRDALRVLSDTASPSERFAVAWRERDNAGSEEPDPENVENLLVRLSDGAVLLPLGGNHWETDRFRANRRDEIAVWSKDSRFLIEISNDRWDTFSLRAVALDGESVTGHADLLAMIEKETRARRPKRKGSPPNGALSFRIDADEAPRLSERGELFLRALLFVPKSEDGQIAVDFRVRLEMKAGRLAPRIVSAKRVRA